MLVAVSFVQELLHRVDAEVAASDEPLIVLLDHDAGGQADERGVVGEDPDDVGAPADLAVDPFERVGIQYERLTPD